jgi:hypothetical protein
MNGIYQSDIPAFSFEINIPSRSRPGSSTGNGRYVSTIGIRSTRISGNETHTSAVAIRPRPGNANTGSQPTARASGIGQSAADNNIVPVIRWAAVSPGNRHWLIGWSRDGWPRAWIVGITRGVHHVRRRGVELCEGVLRAWAD